MIWCTTYLIDRRSYSTDLVGCRSRAHSCWFLAYNRCCIKRERIFKTYCCCTKYSKSNTTSWLALEKLDCQWRPFQVSSWFKFWTWNFCVKVCKFQEDKRISRWCKTMFPFFFFSVFTSTWISEHSSFLHDFICRKIVGYFYSLIFHV